ncbi:hypothetical protein WG66_006109 [Moniliophthora roreri]|uniref:CCHC-type domain-containing protein n=1 Tax=Moniliophthora roreri TaxID=221103 RepID=A0A0W0FC56_MONRR|nr:hypothetical protein WG66_006109 [Moniliophthora roreri]
METGYDDKALIKFYKEGLPESLVNKIMLCLEGVPTTLNKWFSLSIRYDNQYKFTMAQKKKQMGRETVKPKIQRKEKEVVIGKISESDRQDYLAQEKCFNCAKIGHISKDCPLKRQTNQIPQAQRELPKKFSAQETFMKIKAMVLEQGEAEQEEIFDLMGKKGF